MVYLKRLPVPLVPRLARWLAAAGVASVIVYYSLVTVPPEPPSGRPSLWDKQLHFAAYAGLTLVLAYATVQYREVQVRRGVAVFAVVISFGVCIELLQGLLSYRSFGWYDLVANTIGATLGALWFLIEPRVRYVRAQTFTGRAS